MGTISRTTVLPLNRLGELIAESEAAGFHMLRRLEREWASGENRFDAPGEALFLTTVSDRIVGLCGLNRDPYTGDVSIGRVRHLYVLASYRRQGVGRGLIETVVATARPSFRVLRLRTDSEDADRFYIAAGFRRSIGDPSCTHEIDLTHRLSRRDIVPPSLR